MNVIIEQNEATIQHLFYLQPEEIASLYTVAQNGANVAINSLRDFLRTNTEVHLNCLSFLPLPILTERVRLFYPDHYGFHLRFSGEINGEIYTLFGATDALKLIDTILGYKRKFFGKRINRLEISVLAELVNILSNSFWKALSEQTSLNWWISPPTRVNDLARTLSYSSKVYTLDHLLIHLEYFITCTETRIQFILLPSQATLKKLLSRLNHPGEPQLQVCSL